MGKNKDMLNRSSPDFGCQEEMITWCQDKTHCHRFWNGKVMDGTPTYSSPAVASYERYASLDPISQHIQGCKMYKTLVATSIVGVSLKRALEHLNIVDSDRHVRSKPNSPIIPRSLIKSPASGPMLSSKSSTHFLKGKVREMDLEGSVSKLKSALIKHKKVKCLSRVQLLNTA